jgi:hypothetical protein
MELDKLIDGTVFSALPKADQEKYDAQDDGTYKLVGDPTPAVPEDQINPTLSVVVDKVGFEKLSEPVRPFYEPQEDGTMRLRGFEDTRALKNALGRVRAERDQGKEKLKEFEGYDPGELARLRAVEEKVKREAELTRSEFDRQFTEASDQYKAQIELLAGQNEVYKRDLNRALVDNQAVMDITTRGGKAAWLLPHIKDHTEMREVDGRHVAVVIGDDGKPRLKKGATQTTDFLPIADYVDELKEHPEFEDAFRGTGATGGGATNNRTAAQGTAPATVSKQDLKAIGLHADSIAKGLTKVV